MAPLVAWLNTLAPYLAVGVGYAIALWQREATACVPFVEGCTSISAAVRDGDSLFWFRGLMLPISVLLAIYWILQWRWLNYVAGERRRHWAILTLGVISAVALSFYANFLGSDGDVYNFMRRFGVMFYFSFALLAQLISLQSLYHLRYTLGAKIRYWLRWQWALVIAQWLLGLISLAVNIITPENKSVYDNILEWNFGLAMVSFYAISGMIWRQDPPPPVITR